VSKAVTALGVLMLVKDKVVGLDEAAKDLGLLIISSLRVPF
jgi:hypothetical protein